MNRKILPIILIFLFSTAGSLTAMIKIGLFSFSGLFSLSVPIVTFTYYFLLRIYGKKKVKLNLSLALLVLACISWDVINLLKHKYFPQNLSIVLLGFSACILIPHLSVVKNYIGSIYTLLNISSVIYVALLLIVVVFFQEEPAFVQVGVIFFAFHLVRYFLFRNWFSVAIALLIFLATLILNSRIVIIAELIVFGMLLFALNRKEFLQSILMLSFILMIGLVFSRTGIFQNAVYGGDEALEVGGFSVNTSGRFYQWTVIFESFLKNTLLGSGFSIPEELRTEERWNHPHNDYLRLLHHLGIAGLSLWMVFAFSVISKIQKILKLLNSTPKQLTFKRHKAVAYTCAGSFAALLIMMLTDNSIVYNYVMYPIGLLLGSLSIIKADVIAHQKMVSQSSEK